LTSPTAKKTNLTNDGAIQSSAGGDEDKSGLVTHLSGAPETGMHISGGAGPKKPKKVAEIMLEYGFLKRLEEEGKNVKIGAEINDILFLDERDREIKERLEEEHLRKAKKPRPRDIVDFEEIKRNHA
jgi:hypothetical protein